MDDDTTMADELAGRYADATFSSLELAAVDWLDGFYQLEHLLCTRAWAMKISGKAGDALKFAALVHDAERFFPGGPTSTPDRFDDADYLFAHSVRSADVVEEWLRDGNKADEAFILQVRSLILRHEIGGNPEEDILQAADSLSFLESLDWLVNEWVQTGKYSATDARAKLDWMVARMRPYDAYSHALPLYVRAVNALQNPADNVIDFKQRRTLAGCRSFLIGR